MLKLSGFFGNHEDRYLRFVTKFDSVDPLLRIDHSSRTRWRVSLNAKSLSQRLEGGTATVNARIKALRKVALPKESGGGGYPIGVVLAPIMPTANWQEEYGLLLDELRKNLDFPTDLTFELITHRFTPGSREVLSEWYPNSSLEMDENSRSVKRNKFGGTKYIYLPEIMNAMKTFFHKEISKRFADARILYWT